jgi:hypothetical protein
VAFNVQTEAPSLSEDATGALRVGNSRVLLEIVVRAFQDGAAPETFVQRFYVGAPRRLRRPCLLSTPLERGRRVLSSTRAEG